VAGAFEFIGDESIPELGIIDMHLHDLVDHVYVSPVACRTRLRRHV
jgi:hypothetical protein